jgi:1,4-dihydroxy-2-naphthoate octaprenyltransferase
VSAFLSKYYTAAPIKMAYRGMGELFVWFAFGPMAILLAAVGQNVGFHAYIIAGMAVTGLSTLSILLIGQLIDLSADAATGKLGLAARRGTKVTHWVYFTAQLLIVLNIAIVAIFIIENGWPVFAAIVPYILIFPKAWKTIHSHYCEPDRLKPAAGMNVQIHLLFSIGLIVGLGLVLII